MRMMITSRVHLHGASARTPLSSTRHSRALRGCYLVAGAHDGHAVHVRRWLPELACLPACLALEPWRLLAQAEIRPRYDRDMTEM